MDSSIPPEARRTATKSRNRLASNNRNSFGEEYFKRLTSKSILRGKKPLQNRFWIRYLGRLRPSGKLLDLGCGEGFFLEEAERYYETQGADISEYAIKNAKKRRKTTRLCVKDVKHLDFPPKQFNIIVSFDLMEHIDRPLITIKQCNNILKDRGILLISVPNLQSFGRYLKRQDWFGYRDRTHTSLLSRNKWVNLLKKGGFEIVEVLYDGLWDSPYLPGIPRIIQHLVFKFPSTLLFFLGFHFPERLGEDMYLVAIKKKDL
nr:class I SAM-dependent methyltransferase [Candidatus Njordarchaeum guaymaensis]